MNENKISSAIREFRAEAGGYFWLPCPICGRMFGGFEIAEGIGLMHTESTGSCVCKNCAKKAEEINRKKFPNFYGKK